MPDSALKLISWNMAHKQESWRCLLDMDIDLALLQEACRPPDDIAERVEIDPAPRSAPEWDSTFGIGTMNRRRAVFTRASTLPLSLPFAEDGRSGRGTDNAIASG